MRNFNSKYSKPVARERQINLLAVQDILAKTLKAHNIEKKVERYRFVLHWEKIVGEELAKVSKPDAIVNKQLVVIVKSSVWAQQMSFYAETIATRVRKFLDEGEIVEGLRFKVEG